MSVIIGLSVFIIVLSAILIKSESQYRKDQKKSRRLANMRLARVERVERVERDLTVRAKKRAVKFAKKEGEVA